MSETNTIDPSEFVHLHIMASIQGELEHLGEPPSVQASDSALPQRRLQSAVVNIGTEGAPSIGVSLYRQHTANHISACLMSTVDDQGTVRQEVCVSEHSQRRQLRAAIVREGEGYVKTSTSVDMVTFAHQLTEKGARGRFDLLAWAVLQLEFGGSRLERSGQTGL